jgi:hypothetical protein
MVRARMIGRALCSLCLVFGDSRSWKENMRAARKHLSVWLLATSVVAGCRHSVALVPESAAEIRFARDYFQLLRDSGATAVLPRLHPRTQALPNIAANLTGMREKLNSSRAELTLAGWSIRQNTGKPRLPEVMYTTTAQGPPYEVGVWIQVDQGRLVVETFGSSENSGKCRADL